MSEHAFEDSVASYVLGALPEDELAEFEAHLESCPRCRAEVQSFAAVPAALALAVTPAPAPAELRDRIMATVAGEAELLRAAGPEADRAAPRRRRDGLTWLRRRPALAGAGAVALAAAAVAGFVLGDNGGPAGPGKVSTISAQVTPPAGRGARAFLERQGSRLRLEVRHMADPGAGRVYQVWLQPREGAAPTPTPALFTVGRDGAAAVELPATASRATRVMVTSERAGGSRTGSPARPPVISAPV
jgi:anti-sigma factor RsiW